MPRKDRFNPPIVVEEPLARDVRLTLDLSPARYRDLQSWLNESAIRLGRSRVTKQDALNALVALLLRDERTAQMVLANIRDPQYFGTGCRCACQGAKCGWRSRH